MSTIPCPHCGGLFPSIEAMENHVHVRPSKPAFVTGMTGTPPPPTTTTPSPPPPQTPPQEWEEESVLDEAERLISRDRRAEYGPVEESFQRVAAMWTQIISAPVTAKQVALCMAAMKICREVAKAKRDNAVDAAGYIALAQQIEEATLAERAMGGGK